MAQGTWILKECASERFPYRLQILKGEMPWLVLRTQDRWPPAGKNIFCLREDEPPLSGETLREVERVDILAFHERGRHISVVLDRRRYKRCHFLFLSKNYKHKPNESYEEIFWLTQRSIQKHRPVIEAPYSDFLNPKKTEYYSPTFCARSIGELYALHPNLRIVFCSNRSASTSSSEMSRSILSRLPR